MISFVPENEILSTAVYFYFNGKSFKRILRFWKFYFPAFLTSISRQFGPVTSFPTRTTYDMSFYFLFTNQRVRPGTGWIFGSFLKSGNANYFRFIRRGRKRKKFLFFHPSISFFCDFFSSPSPSLNTAVNEFSGARACHSIYNVGATPERAFTDFTPFLLGKTSEIGLSPSWTLRVSQRRCLFVCSSPPWTDPRFFLTGTLSFITSPCLFPRIKFFFLNFILSTRLFFLQFCLLRMRNASWIWLFSVVVLLWTTVLGGFRAIYPEAPVHCV